jgi:hypothetical protein
LLEVTGLRALNGSAARHRVYVRGDTFPQQHTSNQRRTKKEQKGVTVTPSNANERNETELENANEDLHLATTTAVVNSFNSNSKRIGRTFLQSTIAVALQLVAVNDSRRASRETSGNDITGIGKHQLDRLIGGICVKSVHWITFKRMFNREQAFRNATVGSMLLNLASAEKFNQMARAKGCVG